MASLPITNNIIKTDNLEDGITRALLVMDYEHHEVHSGSSFTLYYALTTAATDAHRTAVYFKTPTGTKLIHAIFSFSASTAANSHILEAPTIAANVGTHAVPIYNRYRDSTKTSIVSDNATSPAANKFTTLTEAQIDGDATFAEGTVLRTEPLVAGDGPKPSGGVSRGTEEYILKANTAYIAMIQNTTAAANTHTIEIDWYEHTNR
jgi:hypothetical protein